jgi:hypothetical protein
MYVVFIAILLVVRIDSVPAIADPPLLLAVNWADAKRRVIKSYRDWLRAVRFPSDSKFN